MVFNDFAVRWDEKTESIEKLGELILYSVFIRRMKANKPNVVFLSGDSGEGKSFTALALEEVLMRIQGLDASKHINDMNAYTPLEYPQKLDALLFKKELKKINVLAIHEARELVKAKNWHSFVNQAIGDVNAMSRSIKRLTFIIISQFIRDISTDIRYTLNFYCKVSRPKGKKARLYINVVWKDDRDLEKPKIRKRRLSGYIIKPDGRYQRFVPSYIEISKPCKETIIQFEKNDREAKEKILKRKMAKLIKEMKMDLDLESEKVNGMVKHYSEHPETLKNIGTRRAKKWKVKKEIQKMHDLTKDEVKEFEAKLNLKLQELGIMEVSK